MNIMKIFPVLLALTLLSACATSSKVFTDFDPEQRFDSYKSFSWSSDEPVAVSGTYSFSELSKSRLTNSLKSELEGRGYRFVDNKNNADFLVSLTLGARDKIETRLEPGYQIDPYAWRWGRIYYPHYFHGFSAFSEKQTYQFTQGSIAVDIFDAKSNRPVFYASTSQRLTEKELSGTLSKEQETAKALLEAFPPDSI